ncbi:MAG: uroporphyrinogen decarboxylase family protein [Candidatus Methylomirabilia bacterium]
MTHRERILATLSHKTPDRLPRDLGSTLATTMTAQAHARMRTHLGLPSEPPPATFATRSSTVIPDAAILHRFDADARPLVLGSPDGRPERELSRHALVDEWGVTWTRPEGAHYISTDGPFYHLDEPTVGDLDRVVWPDPADPGRYRGLRERASELHQKTDYAVVLNLGVGPVHQCQFVRGYGEWLEDLLINPAFAEALMDRVVELWIQITDRALGEAGEHVDLVIYGDDVGTQKACLIQPELYRRVIKPRHKRMADTVKRHGKPILFHTCGSVYALIPDLIEVGIDALNPIQVSAAEMDAKRLKREFGRELAFWGGVDTQTVLPLGTPQGVREEVQRRIEDLADGGGYVLSAVHNIQPEVPPENVVAMYEAALEYRR